MNGMIFYIFYELHCSAQADCNLKNKVVFLKASYYFTMTIKRLLHFGLYHSQSKLLQLR